LQETDKFGEEMMEITLLFLVLILVVLTIYFGVKIVPQSEAFVVERFGKYTQTLAAGLNLIIPFVDLVAHRVSVLERQLPEFRISVITRDNVEVWLESTVFFRVVDAAQSVYRIENDDLAIQTAATSIIRSAAGKLDLDALQSSRDAMNQEIESKLREAAKVWGIEITRTEILNIDIDEQTKDAQRQQLNAERQRRAAVAEAEGEKKSIELKAEAALYEAEKEAEAIRVTADAEAYAIKAKAEAQAQQTRLIAGAIADNGQPAIDFEVLMQQVKALGSLAGSENAKTLVVPSDVTKALGSLELLKDFFSNSAREEK